MYEAVRMDRQRDLLLVDDDVELRDTFAQVLEASGFQVTQAANGNEALRHLRLSPPPDLILLDLMMPVKNGWEFRVEQKADPLLASIPVIAMSGDDSPRAAAIDAVGFLHKPVRPNRLVECVRELLGRSVPDHAFAEEASTDRMPYSPLFAAIDRCMRTEGEVRWSGRAYRITETAIGEFEITSLPDGSCAGRFVGSSSSLWRISPRELDPSSIRAIIRAAIDCGLILDAPPD